MTESPPFFPVPEELDPNALHQRLITEAPLKYRWADPVDRTSYVRRLRKAFADCLGEIPVFVPLAPEIGAIHRVNELLCRRVSFAVEGGHRASGWLLYREDIKSSAPAMICLQGHTSGAHISIGVPKIGQDVESIAGDRDFAVQAARKGFIALALEQRCFGMRSDGRDPALRGDGLRNEISDERCRHQSMVSILLGRTMAGERAHDVRCAVNFLETLPEVDVSKIYCMGNSGGGTISFYATCLDERISACMPSCAISTYADSICSHDHCSDNYLPSALNYFDMGDLVALIAPRPMVIVSGRTDPLFPQKGVHSAVKTAKSIYNSFGASDRLIHVEGDGGHRFYARQGWEAFDLVTQSNVSSS